MPIVPGLMPITGFEQIQRFTRLCGATVPMRTILAGVKTSAVINVGTATVAAFVGAGGLGSPISTGLNLNDTSRILEGAVPAAGAPAKKNKTVLGQLDFGGGGGTGSVKTIGRTPDNDIVLSHPQVSSHHASLHRINGQLFVEDKGSANGTFVRGHRIPRGQKIGVQSGEKIYIGPMPLQIEQSASGAAEIVQEEYSADRWAGRPLYEIEAWSLMLEVPDRDNPREMKALLENVSFKALPGDMIALMGPSGAGASARQATAATSRVVGRGRASRAGRARRCGRAPGPRSGARASRARRRAARGRPAHLVRAGAWSVVGIPVPRDRGGAFARRPTAQCPGHRAACSVDRRWRRRRAAPARPVLAASGRAAARRRDRRAGDARRRAPHR